MANMKDLAKATGLSLATISRVFNDSDKVTAQTREIVLSAAEKLSYRPNKMAAALRSGRSNSIGVIVPVIDREVFSSAIKSMEEVLSASGYNIIICQSHESYQREQEIIENLVQLKVAGVIISISKETNTTDHLAVLEKENIPLVFFDRSLELGKLNSVVINNYNGAYQATQHLVDQGCRQIIHLAGKEKVPIFRERRRGFEDALRRNKLALEDGDVIAFDESQANRVAQLTARLAAEPRPDGILAHGDISALVALRVLNEKGIRVPAEVAIVGFGDSLFCTYLEPGLSSVSQRNEDVGRLAASLLLEELQPQEADRVVAHQVLPPVLKIRKSSLRRPQTTDE
ncbi:MAG: LacI family DNA-binding transcriptional regulator [Bacteroidota bacterium]